MAADRLFSALIHSGAAIYSCGHGTGDVTFFMSQAAFILLEDHIIAAGRRLGFKHVWGWRAVGYAWTWAWLLLSWRWWIGPQMSEGLGVFPKPMDLFGFLAGTSARVDGGMHGGHAEGNKSAQLMPVPEI